jgi:ABC-type phosphate transport system ATPase subunit
MKIFKVNNEAMIPRPKPIHQITILFQVHPVTALLGSRQCGKNTLA